MDMKSLIAKMDQLSQVDEATKKKPDFLDKDGDGNTTEPMKKAVADADKDDKEKVDEAIAIQADGQEAMALLDMLKLAGQTAPHQGPDVVVGGMTEADRDIKYVNTPKEKVEPMDAATPSGNDMHREKNGYPAAAGADNPMVAAMEGKLKKMFESLSNEIPEFDPDKMSKKEKKNYMKNVPRWGDDEPKKGTKKKSKVVDIPRWG